MIVMEQQEEKILGMQKLGNLTMPSNIRGSQNSNSKITADPNDFIMEFQQPG